MVEWHTVQHCIALLHPSLTRMALRRKTGSHSFPVSSRYCNAILCQVPRIHLLTRSPPARSSAGDDSVTESVTHLVRGTLCATLKQVLEHGMRRPIILGESCRRPAVGFGAVMIAGGRVSLWSMIFVADATASYRVSLWDSCGGSGVKDRLRMLFLELMAFRLLYPLVATRLGLLFL